MSKILVINSFGPMGSTLLAGLAEKLSFTNVPVRKIGLNQYLMGELAIDSGYMQNRLAEVIKAHSKPTLYGGVSVMDRDQQSPYPLTDYQRVVNKLEQFRDKSFDNVGKLYETARQIYYDAVVYKEIKSNRNWHIILTVDFHRFDPETLVKCYEKNFDEVYMIHLHRDFKGWINSLASQAINHTSLKNRIKFFPHMRYADYVQYEKSVSKISGMHIQFDDLFDRPVEAIAKDIAEFTNTPFPQIDWKKESYDLYGKNTPHDTAFKRFDDNVLYLPQETLNYFKAQAESGSIQKFPTNIVSWLKYLLGMFQYHHQKF